MRKDEFGKIGVFHLFRFAHQIAYAYRVDIAVERFADISVEQAGKVVFIVSEHGGKALQRERFAVVVVDVIERRDDRADVGRGRDGLPLVVIEQTADNDVDISLFDEVGRIFLPV